MLMISLIHVWSILFKSVFNHVYFVFSRVAPELNFIVLLLDLYP